METGLTTQEKGVIEDITSFNDGTPSTTLCMSAALYAVQRLEECKNAALNSAHEECVFHAASINGIKAREIMKLLALHIVKGE